MIVNENDRSREEGRDESRDALGELPHGRPPQTEFDTGLDYPRLGSVTFRRGTLTDNQQSLFDEHWPRLGTVLDSAAEEQWIDYDEWFGRASHPTIVEIGSGTGTSTAAMAPLEADTNIIAVELYKPGLAKLLGSVVRGDIDNVRMIRGDGVEVLARMIAPESLDAVRIFFPDPWPKARHHKRRIIQSGTLNLIATRLKPGGVLHVATDHADYAEWIDELVDPFGVVRVIGGHVEHPARFQTGRDEIESARLDDAPLVVACLRPRIREEDAHSVERFRRDHAGKHLHTVAANHAHVVDVSAHDGAQQLGQPRLVQLHRDDVRVRFERCHRCRRRSGARADFHDRRVAGAAEPLVVVDPLLLGGTVEDGAKAGPMFVEKRLLVVCQRAAAEGDRPQARVVQAGVELGLRRAAVRELAERVSALVSAFFSAAIVFVHDHIVHKVSNLCVMPPA